MRPVSRREILKNLLYAGGVSLLPRLEVLAEVQLNDPAFSIGGEAVQLILQQISATTIRVRFLSLAKSAIPSTVTTNDSLVQQEWPGSKSQLTKAGTFKLKNFVVKVSPDPFVIEVQDLRGNQIQRFQIDTQKGGFTFDRGAAPLLAFGEGGPQFDRRGMIDQMRSGQGGYRLRTHGGRVPIQWLIGTEGWALFIHQPTGAFDLSNKEAKFTPSPNSPFVDLFLVSSKEPATLMGEYARLTGLPEMPPLWSLGYLQSHRTLSGPEEIMWVARTFREKKLPCDALIYLGTDFTPSGWNTHNGEFTWHPKNFPNPKQMVDDLHQLNFKVVLHTVIEGRRLTGTVSDPCTAAPLPSGRTPDGRWPDDRQVSCYWPVHKQLYDVGIDGWWPDQGDGLDAPSRLARNRMYFEGSQQLRPNKRVFALHRNGQAGMQRFAAFLWSGDVYTTWETLKNHVPIAVNTGLSGITYWGTDIGGFVPTKEYTGELHVRWFQFGAFCPLFRAHGRTWHLRLPWGWNTGELGVSEVSNYTGGAADPDASELHNAEVEPICRKYLELRYQLMPYLYSVVREGCQTGLPIMRALWLHHSDDPTAVARGDQFLWGRDILVAPVTDKGATQRPVYLPRGDWFDFWTNERVVGGKEISKPVDLATMPLFVRAGAIIPFGPIKQFTEEKVAGPLTVQIYPGADGEFVLYEDDGKTFDFRRGEWMGLRLRWNDKSRRLTVQLEKGSRMLETSKKELSVRLMPSKETRTVIFAGKPITAQF